MSYKAFALKYRPSNFDEVVGQAHVVSSLKTAILKKHIHHAYLFSGPRGVGKTSLARIFAKSLNCEQGPTVSPCGKCNSCSEITRSTSLDIIEIDGASNRGIDEIRILRENVKLSPAYSRFKVFIIDEVHMLTQEAFNALLKTLEEPPAHVKFIFATTHPQKLLPTILSRCQKYQFSLLTLEQIVVKLKAICKSEKIAIEEPILYAIARSADGSIRDAESLLDQLAPVISEKGSVGEILSFLGVIDEGILNTSLNNLLTKNISASLEFIDKIVNDGKDLGLFLNALIEHFRNLLLAKVSIKSFKSIVDISVQTKESLISAAQGVTTKEILKAIDMLLKTKELTQRINSVRIPLELAFVKLSLVDTDGPSSSVGVNKSNPGVTNRSTQAGIKVPLPPKSIDTKSSLGKQGSLRNKSDITIPAPPVSFDEQVDADLEGINFDDEPTVMTALKPKSTERTSDKAANTAAYGLSADNVLLMEFKAKWKGLIQQMQKIRAALASHLSFAYPCSSVGTVISIGFPKKEYFHKEMVENGKNVQFLEEFISKIMQRKIGIKFVFSELSIDSLGQEDAPVDSLPEESEPSEAHDESENEFITELLDTFGGHINTDDN